MGWRAMDSSGAGSFRYWICAFCVNQHRGICGGFGKPPADELEHRRWDANRYDSVLGRLHEACDCSEPKKTWNAPDEGEMNKFDDMMALLQKEVPDFRQVVAIDRHFDTFPRLVRCGAGGGVLVLH